MAEKTQEQIDLAKQQEMAAQYQQQFMKMQQVQFVKNVFWNSDIANVFKVVGNTMGAVLYVPQFAYNYKAAILQNLQSFIQKSEGIDRVATTIQRSLLGAINQTNTIMCYGGMGMGMNPMMGQMQMGYNPMMMGGGMGMQQPMMGMGMNPMMGQMGYGMMPGMGYGMPGQQFNANVDQNAAEQNDSEKAVAYINANLFNTDPLIFIQFMLINGIEIDFSDPNLSQLVKTAIMYSIEFIAQYNPMVFQNLYGISYQMYVSDYNKRLQEQYAQMQKAAGKNGNGQAQVQNPYMMGGNPYMMQMGYNPMMMGGGMGMQQPMMGMGMNPMMGGMMPPGMANGMDYAGAGMQQPMMMGGNPYMMQMGYNPMMMGGGMGMQQPMMGMGMNYGMMMPGMQGGNGSTNTIV